MKHWTTVRLDEVRLQVKQHRLKQGTPSSFINYVKSRNKRMISFRVKHQELCCGNFTHIPK